MDNIYTSTSRYYKNETLTLEMKNGRKVTALKLRLLPLVSGEKTQIKDAERLDIISQIKYKIPTKFWHIADANSALHSRDLIIAKNKKLPIIEVPNTD